MRLTVKITVSKGLSARLIIIDKIKSQLGWSLADSVLSTFGCILLYYKEGMKFSNLQK